MNVLKGLTKLFFSFLVVVCFLLQPAFADENLAIPTLNSPVMDLTGTLTSHEIEQLKAQALALQQRKGSQLQVLIVASTQPEGIDQYALRVFNAWHLGRKGVDDGVLLLVAKDDHRMRIEVGYGLEGAIPDAYASRINDEYLTPKFKVGDFSGGIIDAIKVIIKLIDGEALPAAPAKPSVFTWSHADNVLLAIILVSLGLGAAGSKKLFGIRPLLLMGAALPVLAGFFVGTPFIIAAAILVVIFVLFGYFAVQHQPTRYALLGLLGLSVIIFGVMSKLNAFAPSMAAIGIALAVIATIAVFLSFPIMLSIACWKKNRTWFFVRLAILCTLIVLGLYYKAHLANSISDPSGHATEIILAFCGYMIWLFCMITSNDTKKSSSKGTRKSTSAYSSTNDRDDDNSSSSSSSSSSDSYSGSGGSSGGGGASGSW